MGPEAARQFVIDQAEAGYDFIKLLRGLSRAEFDAAVRAAAEAGTHLAGHVSDDVGVGRALEAGQTTIDHLDGFPQYLLPPSVDPSSVEPGFYGVNLLDLIDEDRIAQLAGEIRQAGVWIVPTNTMIANVALSSPSAAELAARPQMAYLPPDLVQGWAASKDRRVGDINGRPGDGQRLVELRHRIVKALHDEGAGLLLGSDAPQTFNVPGFSLHRELSAMVDAGLSPYEALRMGTVAPAEFFEAENEFGRIAVGPGRRPGSARGQSIGRHCRRRAPVGHHGAGTVARPRGARRRTRGHRRTASLTRMSGSSLNASASKS